MTKRKYEFRPDPTGTGFLHKLYLTKKQQYSLLRWFLYAMVLLTLSVIQDVILCRISFYGATTDLMPCAIFLICVILGTESGCVFSLMAAAMYQFSGTAPGYHAIVLITVLAVCVTMFRQTYLRKSVSTNILCTAFALVVYEMILFLIGLFLSQISLERVTVFLLTAGLSLLSLPILYPTVTAISKIGGETWKE